MSMASLSRKSLRRGKFRSGACGSKGMGPASLRWPPRAREIRPDGENGMDDFDLLDFPLPQPGQGEANEEQIQLQDAEERIERGTERNLRKLDGLKLAAGRSGIGAQRQLAESGVEPEIDGRNAEAEIVEMNSAFDQAQLSDFNGVRGGRRRIRSSGRALRERRSFAPGNHFAKRGTVAEV